MIEHDCPDCDKQFEEILDLVAHMKEVHGK